MLDDKLGDLVWEVDQSLFSRRMLSQWTLILLASALIMTVLLGIVFCAQKEWDVIPSMLIMIGSVTSGLWLFGLLIMAVVFRGRYRLRYTISNLGIRCDTIDTLAKKVNRLAIVVGTLARNPQTVGSGLIGISRESEEVRWNGTFKVIYEPEKHSVSLRNAWRTLLLVQCTPENYAKVTDIISKYIQRRKAGKRSVGKSPLPAYLGRSLLVVAACFPLFPLAEEFNTGLFLPLLILCFCLAMVWMINLFAWVVIAGLVIQSVLMVLKLLERRESYFHKGEFYRAWEVLSGGNVSLMLIAGIGAAILIWLSVQALRGRWLAALLEGYKDMES